MVSCFWWRVEAPYEYDLFGQLVAKLTETKHDVSVITFNYDVGLDVGLRIADVPIDYCLKDVPARSEPRAVPVLKLHGAIHWAQCARDEEHIAVVELAEACRVSPGEQESGTRILR